MMRTLLTTAILATALLIDPAPATCNGCNGLICRAGDPTCSAMGCACILDISPTMGHCR